jgi:hypothetical protein
MGDQIEITTTRPPYALDGGIRRWNLQQIYSDFNICNRVTTGGIDEVWIWIGGDIESPDFVYGSEWETNGPILSTSYGVFTPPNCGKQMFTMGYNYRVGEGNTLESWVHSAEFTFDMPEFSGLQSCDFGHPGGYGWYGGRGGAAYEQCRNVGYSDVSGFTVQSDPGPYGGPDLTGVCGMAHFPPNVWRIEAVWGSWRFHEYWWDNPRVMASRCTDWQWNIITNTVPISCGAWGCNQPGFFVWWMQNVPGINNNLHGRDGSLRPNWWNYRLAP